jgi:DNA-binding transcriptional LysR family regulator
MLAITGVEAQAATAPCATEENVMDLRQIQYFVSLYEEQSITKAAKRLNVVQPAVSMQIKRLEEDYGVKLFDRTSQGVYPTAIAKTLYPLCIGAMEAAGHARRALQAAAGTVTGELAIGVPPSLANGLLAEQLLEFKRRHPSVQLKVREGYSSNIVEWLTEGAIEFAVVSARENEERLRYHTLVNEELVVVTSRQNRIKKAAIRGVDLAEFMLVLPSRQNLIRILIDAEFERAGFSVTPTMEVDSLAIVFDLISRPGWASILPTTAFRYDARAEKLQSFLLVEPTIHRSLAIAFDSRREISPAAQLLVTQLEEALAGLGAAVTRLPEDAR